MITPPLPIPLPSWNSSALMYYNITEFINENTFFEIIWRHKLKKITLVLWTHTYTCMFFSVFVRIHFIFTSSQTTLKWPNVPDIDIKFDKNIYSRSLKIQEILVAYAFSKETFTNLLRSIQRSPLNFPLNICVVSTSITDFFSQWFFASSYWLIALYSILT